MARAAVLGRLTWLAAQLAGIREETATARTLVLDVPGWAGHLPGQHVDVRLTAEDGYSTERSYSIASAPGGTRIELTIQRLAASGTGVNIDIAYTREAPAGWAGPLRRLDAQRLLDLAGPPATGLQCFICGPTGFVESAAHLLVEQGLGDRQIRTERFGPSGGTS